ncbi:hypothetical protein BVG16_22190 [Paenibacillus selenitireducens]|uniref:N-acetyltransferase domain-containing protein n=1 Tax=Paenibacillus selenitireducens TaxID=1324314 RepID=A0A1T2X5Z9_9BACL|nr:GNAT family N-acetyltransferase [Paenibacillus selenitireducens]OPA75308.1 hypothetical protein BVG16_22190 [Paenibacillus selenitireducens]
MEHTVRFGKLEDLAVITALDDIQGRMMEWKLQNQEYVLAEVDGYCAGFIRLEYLWSKYPYIGMIRVERPYQRQGLGIKMLLFVEEALRQQGVTELYSSSQADEADPQAWHRYMGFRECGIISGINEGEIGEIFFVKSMGN